MLREHPPFALVTTDRVLADARAVIGTLSADRLAADWEERIRTEAEVLGPAPAGHPAIAAAAAGDAATVLSLDPRLQSAKAGAAIRSQVATSVKSPAAFVALVDPDTFFADEPTDG